MEALCICEGVQEIGEHAFIGCNMLKTVTIPGTIICVETYAFSDCKNLESVYICEGVEELNAGIFLVLQCAEGGTRSRVCPAPNIYGIWKYRL